MNCAGLIMLRIPRYSFPSFIFLGSRQDSDLSSSPPIKWDTPVCLSLTSSSESPIDQTSYEVCFVLSTPTRLVVRLPDLAVESAGKSRERFSRCLGLTCNRESRIQNQSTSRKKETYVMRDSNQPYVSFVVVFHGIPVKFAVILVCGDNCQTRRRLECPIGIFPLIVARIWCEGLRNEGYRLF